MRYTRRTSCYLLALSLAAAQDLQAEPLDVATFRAGEARLWLIAAGDNNPVPNAVVPQKQGREVTGRIVDEQQQPVADALVAGLAGLVATTEPAKNITRTDAEGRFKLSDLPEGSVAYVAGKASTFVSVRTEANELPDLVLRAQSIPERNLPGALRNMMQLVEAAQADETFPASVFAGIAATYDIAAAGQALVAANPAGQPAPEELRRYLGQYLEANPDARSQLVALLPEVSNQAGDDAGFPRFLLTAIRLIPNPQDEVVPGEEADIATLREWVYRNYLGASQKLGALDLTGADSKLANQLAWYAVLSSRLDDGLSATWAQKAFAIVNSKPFPADDSPAAGVLKILALGGAPAIEPALKNAPPEKRASLLGQSLSVLAKTDLPAARRLLQTIAVEAKTTEPTPADISTQNSYGLGVRAVLQNLQPADAGEALTLARSLANESGRAEALALAARLQPPAEASALFQEAFDLALSQKSGARQGAEVAGIALDFDAALGAKLLNQAETKYLGAPLETEDLAGLAYLLARSEPARARVWLEWLWAREQAKPKGITPNSAACIALAMLPASLPRATQMAEAIPSEATTRVAQPRQAQPFDDLPPENRPRELVLPPGLVLPGTLPPGALPREGLPRKAQNLAPPVDLTVRWSAQYRIAQWMATPEPERQPFSALWPIADVTKAEIGW